MKPVLFHKRLADPAGGQYGAINSRISHGGAICHRIDVVQLTRQFEF